MIRRDLATVRGMAADVTAGMPVADVRAGIESLATNGPLWQLRINCMRYCQFVHAHHHGESAEIFPALRRTNPALNPVVDKLEADHRAVADLLDEVQAAAGALSTHEGTDARDRLSRALLALSVDLLTHLEYEEEHISDTLRTWTGWPYG
jgi:hypothetical protein